jgi:adenosylcobinamide-GDP ribazoletransferase
MAMVMGWVPYARPSGLASAFGDHRWRGMATVTGLALAYGLAAFWRPGAGAAAVTGGTVAAVAVVWLAWRRLGGYSGDVLGAAGVVGETVGLLVAAAKW